MNTKPQVLAAAFLLPSLAFAQAPPTPRTLTLDEALRSAKSHNRDLQAGREHLHQAEADIDRARALLLPTASLQGKYTHNNTEVKLDFGALFSPGPLQQLGTQLQATSLQTAQDAIQDLYAKTNTVPSAKVQQDFASAMQLAQQVSSYCTTNPGASECVRPPPTVIQKQEQLDLNISAQVPLVVPYAWAQLRGARQSVEAQVKTTEATEVQIYLSVAQAFFLAAGNDEVLAARRHAVEVAQKTLSDAEVRFQAGVVNKVEVMRAKVAVLRAEQAVRESTDASATAYRSLRTLTGEEGEFRVVPAEEPQPIVESVPDLVKSAYGLRREILAFDRQIIAADSNVLTNRLRWSPSLSAFGLLRAFNYGGFANQNYAWAVGLSLDWLIYDGGIRDATARQFESVMREVKLRREQLKDQIADEVLNYRESLETKRRGLLEATQEVELARQTLDLVRVQREAGTATQLDLLTSQDALVQAEVNVARLRFDLGLTDLQLRRAAGTFPNF